MKQQNRSYILEKALEFLTDDCMNNVLPEILSNNEIYQKSFRKIDKAIEGLSLEQVNEIEGAYCEQFSEMNKALYRQAFQDGMNMMLEMMGEKQGADKNPRYMILELESRRKDAQRIYRGSKTGWIYKIVRVIREYVSEEEADRDLFGLREGLIAEKDLKGKRYNKALKLAAGT